MARVMDRRMVDAGLKEIAQKEAAAIAAEEAKIGGVFYCFRGGLVYVVILHQLFY